MRNITKTISTLGLFLSFAVLPALKVNAQEATTLKQGNLTITPFLIEENFEKGQSKILEIEVSNSGEAPVAINMSINDFEPTGNQGQVKFLPTGENSKPSISLVSWIEIVEQPNFSLAPFSKTKVKLKITPPTEAEPGTHYGGILFGTDSRENPDGSTIVQKLGTLIVANLGKAKESGKVKDFKVFKAGETMQNLDFVVRFANTGNVHLKPKGEIEIKNWLGKTVGFAYINKDAAMVLPYSEREFQSFFDSKNLFGYYTLDGWVKYGNPKMEERFSRKIWILPLELMVKNLAIAGLLLVGLYFAVRKYNAYLFKKANIKKE